MSYFYFGDEEEENPFLVREGFYFLLGDFLRVTPLLVVLPSR